MKSRKDAKGPGAETSLAAGKAEMQCFLLEPQEGNEVRAAGGEVREGQEDQDRKGVGRSLALTCYLAQ